MNVPVFIAKRYLFSKKSVNAINIISAISSLGVLVGSAALIIILSVFNGFELLILNMYSTHTPDIRVEPAQGKSFKFDEAFKKKFDSDSSILHYSEILQEKVLLKYGQNQFIGTLKGQTSVENTELFGDKLINQGQYLLEDDTANYAVIGAAVQAYLGISLDFHESLITVYSPKKEVVNSLNPSDEFVSRTILPKGVMTAQSHFDDIIITSLPFAREVIGEDRKVSALEFYLHPETDEQAFQAELTQFLGDGFLVKNRSQQNPVLYKVLNSEKWAIFFILTFVLIIAIFNIIGSLTMLVIDKKKDIAVLRSLGADASLIKNIFFTEGLFIALIGCITGMLCGLVFCLLQQNFGLIKMDGAELVTDVFPVVLKASDFLLVFLTVVLISSIAAFVSSRLSMKGEEQLS